MTSPLLHPAVPPTAAARRQTRIAWFVVVLCIGLPSLMLYGVVSSFSLGGDAAALRNAVHGGGGPELRLGAVTLGAIRFGLRAFGAEPEIQQALEAVRSVECGVYPFGARTGGDLSDQLRAGDAAMKGRGWSRMIGVTEGDNLVGVYARDLSAEAEDVDLCVMVQHQDHLMVAGATCRMGVLLDLLGEEGRRFAGGLGISDGRPRKF